MEASLKENQEELHAEENAKELNCKNCTKCLECCTAFMECCFCICIIFK